MAEALARNIGLEAESAGTNPGKKIANNAIIVIKELGINMENQYPKSVDNIDSQLFDKIISMGCGVECPDLPIFADWGLDDPVGSTIDFYRNTRDKIQLLLEEFSQTQTDA
jgi:arsenate reductase